MQGARAKRFLLPTLFVLVVGALWLIFVAKSSRSHGGVASNVSEEDKTKVVSDDTFSATQGMVQKLPISNSPSATTGGDRALLTTSEKGIVGSNQTGLVVIDFPQTNGYQVGETNEPRRTALELVWIAPGSFTMGSAPGELGQRDSEVPQTFVTISRGFWLGEYEVTIAQFEDIFGTGSATHPMPLVLNTGDTDKPVSGIRWEQATNFCWRLTERDRGTGQLPEGYVYRLPSEAEWEYACRAGTMSRFSFGDYPSSASLDSNVWYAANGDGMTQRIGTKLPNVWGLYDMEGNLREWCLDWLPKYPGGSMIDPIGILSGRDHVLRGGAWDSPPQNCRCAFRHSFPSGAQILEAGFRVALAPQVP